MRSYYQFAISEPDLEIGGRGIIFFYLINDTNIKFLPKTVGNNKLGQKWN